MGKNNNGYWFFCWFLIKNNHNYNNLGGNIDLVGVRYALFKIINIFKNNFYLVIGDENKCMKNDYFLFNYLQFKYFIAH